MQRLRCHRLSLATATSQNETAKRNRKWCPPFTKGLMGHGKPVDTVNDLSWELSTMDSYQGTCVSDLNWDFSTIDNIQTKTESRSKLMVINHSWFRFGDKAMQPDFVFQPFILASLIWTCFSNLSQDTYCSRNNVWLIVNVPNLEICWPFGVVRKDGWHIIHFPKTMNAIQSNYIWDTEQGGSHYWRINPGPVKQNWPKHYTTF